MNAATPIAVDPSSMLTVTLSYPAHPTGERIVNAISCRYVPVTIEIRGQPRRVVAVEVIHDPNIPMPPAPYVLNAAFAERLLLPASSLRLVQPYAPAG